jgi:ribosomal protein S13
MQAMGALCCFNGIGQSTAKKILMKHTLQELMALDELGLVKAMTLKQAQNFKKVRESHVE